MVELIPPDPAQCQCEKSNGNSFMTFGGVPGYVRCTNKPVCFVFEREPGKDRLKGAMSLCPSCWTTFLTKVGKAYDFRPVGWDIEKGG